SFQGGEIPIRQAQLDSVLEKVNASMSTYIPTSTISLFNASGDSVFCYDGKEDPYFKVVFLRSKEIHALSRRSFNPAIMPLVNYYGFGYEKSEKVEAVDTAYITKTLPVIQFDSITLSEDPATGQICINKKSSQAQLDFSAIAKGYGVDLVASFLEKNKI